MSRSISDWLIVGLSVREGAWITRTSGSFLPKNCFHLE